MKATTKTENVTSLWIITIQFYWASSGTISELCWDKTKFIVSILPQIAIFSRAAKVVTAPVSLAVLAWREEIKTREGQRPELRGKLNLSHFDHLHSDMAGLKQEPENLKVLD